LHAYIYRYRNGAVGLVTGLNEFERCAVLPSFQVVPRGGKLHLVIDWVKATGHITRRIGLRYRTILDKGNGAAKSGVPLFIVVRACKVKPFNAGRQMSKMKAACACSAGRSKAGCSAPAPHLPKAAKLQHRPPPFATYRTKTSENYRRHYRPAFEHEVLKS
jgi:hypothetical protein